MCEVLFVTPSKEPTTNTESLGTLLLATILKNKGINVDIFRFSETDMTQPFNNFVDEACEKILQRKPAIVSFYCRCDVFLSDIMIAKKLKETAPEVIIVFGGPQADISSYDTLSELDFVDFCCSGEGETTIHPLFYALLNKGDYSDIPGLTYRKPDGSIAENPRPKLIQNLDDTPLLDYSLIPEEYINNDLKNRIAPSIDVGRGCPFNCAYCSTSMFWERNFRIKSSHRIIEEMMDLHNKYGFTQFNFEHDLFTASKKRIMEFCNALKELDKDFIWSCSSRVDTIDEESIVTMAENGLKAIYLGIETGSQRIQKLSNKNLNVENVPKIVKLLVDNKINVTASFMYGFPEETEEDLEMTLQLVYKLYKLGVRTFSYHLCTIHKGTKYYNDYIDKLTPTTSYSDQVTSYGIEENAKFIENHRVLFPFFYEYASPLRDKFGDLKLFAGHSLIIYDLFSVLFPEKFKDMKFTEIITHLQGMFALEESLPDSYEMARLYGKRFIKDSDFDKLSDIISFYKDFNSFKDDRNATADIKAYGVDVKDVYSGKPFDEIRIQNNMTYFSKNNGTVNISPVAI